MTEKKIPLCRSGTVEVGGSWWAGRELAHSRGSKDAIESR